jgi:nitroimidazol reductase NimA-like FMN-containing flavoprotein (pyridoxamine 5'-phosphate oxidase superfamily)
MIQDLNKQECCELLKRVGCGRLACASKNQPYVVPIYFAYEPNRLFGFSTVGQKIEWMRENPRVCVEADEVIGQDNWTSVLVFGRYEELPDSPKYAALRLNAHSLLEKRTLWWRPAIASSETRGQRFGPFPVFYCIHIVEVTGHRSSPDQQKVSQRILQRGENRATSGLIRPDRTKGLSRKLSRLSLISGPEKSQITD